MHSGKRLGHRRREGTFQFRSARVISSPFCEISPQRNIPHCHPRDEALGLVWFSYRNSLEGKHLDNEVRNTVCFKRKYSLNPIFLPLHLDIRVIYHCWLPDSDEGSEMVEMSLGNLHATNIYISKQEGEQ